MITNAGIKAGTKIISRSSDIMSMDDFPKVRREQAVELLQRMKEMQSDARI